MCGIVTVISKNKSYEKLLNNLKKINFHRGPDKINTLFRIITKYCLEDCQLLIYPTKQINPL